MSEAVFEKAGTFTFTVTKGLNAEAVKPDSLVSARLYVNGPTQAQIEDDDNTLSAAIESITTWSDSLFNPHEKLIAYAAITDPDPNSNKKHEQYYWAFSYKLTSGGNTIREVRAMTVYRPHVVSSQFSVTAHDIYELEHKLENVFSNRVHEKIDLAKRLVKQELRGKGYDLRLIEQEDAKDLVRYKAVMLCCMSLSSDRDVGWGEKVEFYKEHYKDLLGGIPLGYDVDADGDIEPGEEVTPAPAVWFAMR